MDSFSLLSLFTQFGCACFFIFAVGGFIWLINAATKNNKSSPPQTISQDNYETIKWLVKQKANGYNTITELIDALHSQNPLPVTNSLSEPYIAVEPPQSIQEQPVIKYSEIPQSSVEQIAPQVVEDKGFGTQFNAKVLLYLGSSLVVFAIFILVAFNWEAFPNLLKSIILIGVTLAFYILGYWLYKIEHLKEAGITFILIASISVGFLGFGLWTFGIKDLGLDFNWYWFYYSILTFAIYVFTYHLLKVRSLYYLLILSIYAFFTSTSFLIATDNKFRITIFLVLNYFLFLITLKYDERQLISYITRILNQILNVLVIGTILLNIDTLGSTQIKIIASIAVLIPTLFEITSYLKDKIEGEIHISIISFPVKALMIANIFAIDNGFKLVIFILLICVYTLISEIIDYYYEDKKELIVSFKGITWIISFIISAIIVQNWISPEVLNISTPIKIFAVIAVLATLLIPEIIAKSKFATSIISIYGLFAFSKIFSIVFPSADLNVFIVLFSAILLILTLLQAYISKRDKTFLIPLEIATAICVSFLALISQNWSYILLGFTCIDVALIENLMVFKLPQSRFLTVPINAIIYYSLIQCLISRGIMTSRIEITGLAFLIPAVIYAYSLDILNHIKKENIGEIFGFIFFTTLAVAFTFTNATYLLYTTILILLYGIYTFFRFKLVASSFVIFIASQVVLFISIYKLNFNNPNYLQFLMCSSILIAIFAAISKIKFQEDLLLPFKNLSLACAILILPVLFFGAFNIEYISYELIIASICIVNVFICTLKSKEYGIALSGLSILFLVFHLAQRSSAHLDYYVFAIAIYLLTLSLLLYKLSHAFIFENGEILLTKVEDHVQYSYAFTLENIGYIFPFTTLLLQSIGDASEFFKFATGAALIILSIGLLFFALARKNKNFIVISIGFIGLELFIRLYSLILSIPWWIYLGLIGFGLISLAVYIINKNAKKEI